MRLRHATRLFNGGGAPTREALTTLLADDILASRVFMANDNAAGDNVAGDSDGT
jgi:hypothetical protein